MLPTADRTNIMRISLDELENNSDTFLTFMRPSILQRNLSVTVPITATIAEWMSSYINPAFCVLGLSINLLAALILCRRIFNTTSIFLLVMGLYDTIIIASMLLVAFTNHWLIDANPTLAHYASASSPDLTAILTPMQNFYILLNWFNYFCFHLSNWMTVVVAIDRLRGICQQLRLARSHNSLRRSLCIIFAVLALSFLLYLPHLLRVICLMQRQERLDSWLFVPHSWFLYYRFMVDFVVTFLIPAGILLIVNVKLILEVRQSTKFLLHQANASVSETLSRMSKLREIRITYMLIALIIIFMLCQLPFVLFCMSVTFLRTEWRPWHGANEQNNLLPHLLALLYLIKNDVNFAIYCWFSHHFRKYICWLCAQPLTALKNSPCMRQVNELSRHRNTSGSLTGGNSNVSTSSSSIKHHPLAATVAVSASATAATAAGGAINNSNNNNNNNNSGSSSGSSNNNNNNSSKGRYYVKMNKKTLEAVEGGKRIATIYGAGDDIKDATLL